MNKESLAFERRRDLVNRLGVREGSPNYESILHGPPVCVRRVGRYVDFRPLTDSQKSTIAHLEVNGEVKVVHVMSGKYDVMGESMEMESYIVQSCFDGDDGQISSRYGEIFADELPRHELIISAYVKNLSEQSFSQYGDIAIANFNDYIVRTM